MKNKKHSLEQTYWNNLVESENAFYGARMAFSRLTSIEKVSILRIALQKATQRGCALRYLINVKDIDCNLIINELLEISSISGANIELARQLILMADKANVLPLLKTKIDVAFTNNDDEVIRRLAELSLLLDKKTILYIIDCAMSSTNMDIKEIGSDFLALIMNVI